MPFTSQHDDILTALEKVNAKPTPVDPNTNQPAGVPAFQPPGVSGYDQQTGNVTSPADKVGAFVSGANDLPIVGPAMHAGDSLVSALATKGIDTALGLPTAGVSLEDRYSQNQDYQKRVMAENPNTALAGQIAGSAVVGSGIPNPASMTGGAMVGGGIGAADSITHAAANGELPSPLDVLKSTIGGAAGGALFYGVGRAASDVLAKFGLAGKPLTATAQNAIKQRNNVENAAGQAMDASGVVISKDAISNLTTDVMTELGSDGFSRQTSKSFFPVLKMLQQQDSKGVDISLREFNNLRQRIRDGLPAGVSPNDRHWQGIVMDQMNGLINELPKPGIAIQGDASAGLKAWQDMNAVTMDKRRADVLADMFYRAELTASQRGKGLSLGQAMQTEALNFLTATGKRAEKMQSLFDGPQKQVLENLVKGTPGTAWNNMQERLLGQSLVYNTMIRGPIRLGTMAAEKVTGGGDAATRKIALDLLESTGQNAEALGGGNIPRSNVNLTGTGALLASRLTQQYTDRQSKIDTLLEVERAKQAMSKTGFPQSTVVPPPQAGQGGAPQPQGAAASKPSFPRSTVVPPPAAAAPAPAQTAAPIKPPVENTLN